MRKRRACPDCHGTGRNVITQCPWKIIKASVLDVPMAADLAAKGSWPVGGGWLDQTASCLAAVRYWWSLEAGHKAELGVD